MNIKQTVASVVAIAIGILVFTGALVPVISDVTTEYNSVENEGSGWIRMTYNTSPVDFDISVTIDNNTITVSDSAGEQSGSEDTIIYADSNLSVWVKDGVAHFLGTNDNKQISGTLSNEFRIQCDGNVTINDNGTYEFGAYDWAFIPSETGRYGFFNNGTEVQKYPADLPLATVGQYGNVYTYNDVNNFDLPLGNDVSGDEGYIDGSEWVKEEPDPEPESEPTLETVSPLESAVGTYESFTGKNVLMAVPTPDYTSGDWGYNLQSVSGTNYARIVSYSGAGGAVTIPATIGGYSVYSVGKGGSQQTVFNTSLQVSSLTVSEGIKEINSYAFQSCTGLTGTLTLPNSLTTIGQSAFYKCGISGTLTIPSNVTVIRGNAFAQCTQLTSVSLPEGLLQLGETSSTGSGAFAKCTGLTGTLTLPSTLQTIGAFCFDGCTGLTGALVIPDSVTTINRHAFGDCSGFDSLTLSNGLTQISSYVFQNCTGFTNTLTIPSSVTSIWNYAFENCKFTGTLTLPNSLHAIESYAFHGCTGFTGSLTIPNTITTLGGYAFSECTGFTGNIVIPDSVTTIGSGVFEYCTGFDGTLTLPNITRVPSSIVRGCTGLTGSITIPQTVTEIRDSAFSGCTGFTGSLTIPSNVTTIMNEAFYNCSGLTGHLTIPDSVTSISSTVFKGCSGFTGLTLGTGLSTIMYSTFENCSGLSGTLIIPGNVKTIGQTAFKGCTGLTGLVLSEGVESLYSATQGNYASFAGCYNLSGTLTIPSTMSVVYPFMSSSPVSYPNISTVIISEGVKEIKANVFSYWPLTGDLNLPQSLEKIGYYAFGQCKLNGTVTVNSDCLTENNIFNYALITKIVLNNVTKIQGEYVFAYTRITEIEIPDTVTYLGKAAFSGSYYAEGDLIIPDSVTEIGADCFSGYGNLVSQDKRGNLYISKNITDIKPYTFRQAYLVGELSIPEGVKSIGNMAFESCKFTGPLHIPEGVETIGNNAFYDIHFSEITFPHTLVSIGNQAFYNSPIYMNEGTNLVFHEGLESIASGAFGGDSTNSVLKGAIVLPSTLTEIGAQAFYKLRATQLVTLAGDITYGQDCLNMPTVTSILDLSDSDWATNRYGNIPSSAEVRTSIDSMGYLGSTTFSETVQKEGALYTTILVVPIVTMAGIMIAGYCMLRRP